MRNAVYNLLLRPETHEAFGLFKICNIYLTEAYEGEHGEDGRRQGEDQQVFADAVPLQAGVHQEGDQAECCWSLKS